jgi:hypothetical protein
MINLIDEKISFDCLNDLHTQRFLENIFVSLTEISKMLFEMILFTKNIKLILFANLFLECRVLRLYK